MALNKYGWFLDGNPGSGLVAGGPVVAESRLLYFELTITHAYDSGFDPASVGFGIADGTASLSDTGFWNNAAEQADMAGVFGMHGNTQGSTAGVNYPNPRYGAPAGSVSNNVYACAVNFVTDLIWFKNITAAGTWVGSTTGGDPAAGTLGWSIAGLFTGPVYAFGGTTQRNDTNYGAGTLNLGGSAFVGTPPTGYVAWGAADTLNPSDKYSGITLSGGNLTFSTSGAGDLASQGRIVRTIGAHS